MGWFMQCSNSPNFPHKGPHKGSNPVRLGWEPFEGLQSAGVPFCGVHTTPEVLIKEIRDNYAMRRGPHWVEAQVDLLSIARSSSP